MTNPDKYSDARRLLGAMVRDRADAEFERLAAKGSGGEEAELVVSAIWGALYALVGAVEARRLVDKVLDELERQEG